MSFYVLLHVALNVASCVAFYTTLTLYMSEPSSCINHLTQQLQNHRSLVIHHTAFLFQTILLLNFSSSTTHPLASNLDGVKATITIFVLYLSFYFTFNPLLFTNFHIPVFHFFSFFSNLYFAPLTTRATSRNSRALRLLQGRW